LSETELTTNEHISEIKLLMYVERQLDRDSASLVSLHTQTCTRCMNLLRALDRESRLLTRAMLEQDEPLPVRLANFQFAVRRSMQWIWGVIFGLAVMGVYALYSGYIEPMEQQFEQAGFGSVNLLSLLLFQGALWKGWQSMLALVQALALVFVMGLVIFAFRKYIRRGSALAMMFASLALIGAMATPAGARDFRKGDAVDFGKNESIKGDLFLSGHTLRVEGTVDGDVYAFGQQVDVSGHITGDLICFSQSARVSGQVDGNIRSFNNNLTISGSVGRSVTAFNELFTLDSNGKIGHNLTVFVQTLTLDGKIDGDLLGRFGQATLSGLVGGSIDSKGKSLTLTNTAEVDGKATFEGDNPASVASDAKLASPLVFTKMTHRSDSTRDAHYYLWRSIWTAAFILFGLVLISLMPRFAVETVEAAEHLGASFGLGVLVLPGIFIAAIIACITVVGLLVGISTFMMWVVAFLSAEVVVGAIVGTWIMGRTTELWPLVGRMALGVILVRVMTSLPWVGFWAGLAVLLWGMGAISLALYRRLQPVVASTIPSGPIGPIGTPLPPTTTVGAA
jgi:cytoskeletal protein CcmA (bactofilin family)